MAEWISFLHAPRDRFAQTMTDQERAVFAEHFAWTKRLYDEGVMLLVGVSTGDVNTGVAVFVADDEAAAQAIVDSDPVARAGIGHHELRPFHVGLLHGRGP